MNVPYQATPASTNGDTVVDGQGAAVVPTTLVDASRLREALRHSRSVWLATTVLGALIAVGLSIAFAPQYSATTVVLLRHDPNQSDPARAMETAAELVGSKAVAQRAVDAANLRLSASRLVASYEARPLSNDVLHIRARGPTARDAVRRAGAVSAAFLDLRREVIEQQAEVAVDALEDRRLALTKELADVNIKIAQATAATNAGGSATPSVQELLSRRAGLTGEEAELRRRMDDAIIGAKLVVNNSRVVDPASEDPRSTLKPLAANTSAGVVCGLVLGMGLVMVQEVTSDRVRRRRDVMSALRIPVVLSVGRLWIMSWVLRREIRRRLAGGQPRTSWLPWRRNVSRVAAYLRHSLDGPQVARRQWNALAVISVDSDSSSAVAIATTALDLVAEGKKVLLADLSDGGVLARLFGVSTKKTGATYLPGTHLVLWVPSLPIEIGGIYGPSGSVFERLRDEAEVTLALVRPNPAAGPWQLTGWADEAVVVVTAGRPTVDALLWTRQLLVSARSHLAGAVLVGASRRDDTVALAEDSSQHPVRFAAPDSSSH